jgi:uncharacterized membrane protein YfcA
MFPVSVVVATVAMASGVEGATVFSPIFILALGLPPHVAIGAGLITETFGFASGLYAYSRKKLIDYRLGLALLVVTVPTSILGSFAAGLVPAVVLKTILGVGLMVVAASFLRSPTAADVSYLDRGIRAQYGDDNAETVLVTAEGEEIRYTVCNRTEGMTIAGLGSLFMGMVSTGLGELNGYFLLQRCRVPSKVAVATSVFIVVVTALTAATGHLVQFVRSGPEVLETVLSLVVFTVPGVVIGGQLGPYVSNRISQHTLERGMGLLFALVGLVTLFEVVLRSSG